MPLADLSEPVNATATLLPATGALGSGQGTGLRSCSFGPDSPERGCQATRPDAPAAHGRGAAAGEPPGRSHDLGAQARVEAGTGAGAGGSYGGTGGAHSALAGDEDTCALYQELIRSKGVPFGAKAPGQGTARRTPPSASSQQGTATTGTAAATATAGSGSGSRDGLAGQSRGASAVAVGQDQSGGQGQGLEQGQGQGQSRGRDQGPGQTDAQVQAQQLSSTLNQLETLWVSSGQAALTPSRAKRPGSEALQAALTPSRSRAGVRPRTPSRSQTSHEHFTRAAARAAAEAQGCGDGGGACCGGEVQAGAGAQEAAAVGEVAGLSDGGGASTPDVVAAGGSGSAGSAGQGAGSGTESAAGASGGAAFAALPAQYAPPPSWAIHAPASSQPLGLPDGAGPRQASGRVLSPGTSQLLSKVYGTSGMVPATSASGLSMEPFR